MTFPKPSKYTFIIVIAALLLSIVISMAGSGPTSEEIKSTLVYAGIKDGVTFSINGQTYKIENISVSKEGETRYAVRFNTYPPQ
jgi:hypothetical protein